MEPGGIAVEHPAIHHNAYNALSVELEDGTKLAQQDRVLCGQILHYRKASVSVDDVNCASRTVAVTIDNTAAPAHSTRFNISDYHFDDMLFPDPSRFNWYVAVPEGSRRVFTVPLSRLTDGVVHVAEDGFHFPWLVYEHRVGRPCTGAASVGPVKNGQYLAATGGVSRAALAVAVILLALGGLVLLGARTALRRPGRH
ncbi:hypothetical protein [Angustibacter sp. Root456]|uniref:hypothetical protein n=1 Tax=Angustibacter sp. Root456 TaxID=1736539 RepID=UPI0006FFA189|nr:hypothetical protein [Angustibacter sp. Root456]KQX69536.1 hypothetical protein ASD06_00185 [Angustibacter sp. Root456]